MTEIERNQKTDIMVNSKGQLYQRIRLKNIEMDYINSLRDDNWLGIYFSFNPKHINKTLGW